MPSPEDTRGFDPVQDAISLRERFASDRSVFEAVINATDTMLVYLDREFNFLLVNAAYAATCGMRPEEMVGRNHFALYPHAENEAIFRKVRDTGQPAFFKYKAFEFPDQPERGTTYWDWSLIPVKDLSGCVTGLVFTLRETTANKLAEQALRNSERLYRAIGESIDYGVWVCAPDGRNVYASDSFLRLVGLTQQQCSDFGWGDVLHPDDSARTIDAWKECVRAGGTWDIEHRFRGTDGNWHSILARGVPVRDDANQIICWAGINLDIGRLKRAEEKTQWQNSILQGINRILEQTLHCRTLPNLGHACLSVVEEITQSPVGFIVELNPGGEIENIAVDIPGYGSGTVMDAFPAALEIRKIFGRSIREGAFFNNNPAPRPDSVGTPPGHPQLTALLCAPLIRDGKITGTIAVANRAGGYGEPELEALQALAPVIAEAFASRRAEDELYAAKAQAEESNRAKDRFLALLGHELRNPLAPIRNSVALLKRLSFSDPELQRARDMIDRQVSQLARLTDDLLDVSRIASGKMNLRKDEIDLVRVVHCTLEDHRGMLEAKGLQVAFAETGGDISVIGDQARISQVIGNLLHNAGKFADHGGHVFVAVKMADSTHAEISISDDGIGMDEATLKGIFHPFVQADISIERSSGGLGLGLALARGIVELHGGSINARSEGVGSGSTFQVRLPATLRTPRPATASRTIERSTRSLSVLLVEDNEDSAESLRLLLELVGHRVTVAISGTEGIEAARRERPEVVLCDIGLPEADGYAVARELRNDPMLRTAYLVAITGYGLAEDRAKARSAGFDTHLTKPVDFDQLERLLAEVPLKREEAD